MNEEYGFSSEKIKKYYWWKQLQLETDGTEELVEVDIATRRRRAMVMRRMATRLKTARARAEKRAPTQQKIMARARKQAIKMLKKRISKKDVSDMSNTERQNVENRVAKMGPAIDRLSKRLYQKVRQAATDKLHRKSESNQKKNEQQIDAMFKARMDTALVEKLMGFMVR